MERRGRKVTSLGVLFDFTGNDVNTTVQKVEDMVKEHWVCLDVYLSDPVDPLTSLFALIVRGGDQGGARFLPPCRVRNSGSLSVSISNGRCRHMPVVKTDNCEVLCVWALRILV